MNMKSITVPGTSTDDVFIGKFCWKRVISPGHVLTSKSLKSEFKRADIDKPFIFPASKGVLNKKKNSESKNSSDSVSSGEEGRKSPDQANDN